MLTVENLRVAYDGHEVLRGLDLELGASEIVCILGPSGGGKSTLLRAVAGLTPYTGLVAVDGRDLTGVATHRRQVGMMFQDDVLFPHLDVERNVGFGLRPADPARVAQMLELVGLAGFGPRPVETLSGGQAQRVALARALAPSPRLLLLDEPFGALDVVLKGELVLEVQRVLREQGMTVLAVSHDRNEAFTLADRVAILREGRIVQIDTPDVLWRRPADEYVARLVGLSVIDGVGYPPDHLAPVAGGPWRCTVTAVTFSAGEYVVTGEVGSDQVSYVARQEPPAVGQVVQLGTVGESIR